MFRIFVFMLAVSVCVDGHAAKKHAGSKDDDAARALAPIAAPSDAAFFKFYSEMDRAIGQNANSRYQLAVAKRTEGTVYDPNLETEIPERLDRIVYQLRMGKKVTDAELPPVFHWTGEVPLDKLSLNELYGFIRSCWAPTGVSEPRETAFTPPLSDFRLKHFFFKEKKALSPKRLTGMDEKESRCQTAREYFLRENYDDAFRGHAEEKSLIDRNFSEIDFARTWLREANEIHEEQRRHRIAVTAKTDADKNRQETLLASATKRFDEALEKRILGTDALIKKYTDERNTKLLNEVRKARENLTLIRSDLASKNPKWFELHLDPSGTGPIHLRPTKALQELQLRQALFYSLDRDVDLGYYRALPFHPPGTDLDAYDQFLRFGVDVPRVHGVTEGGIKESGEIRYVAEGGVVLFTTGPVGLGAWAIETGLSMSVDALGERLEAADVASGDAPGFAMAAAKLLAKRDLKNIAAFGEASFASLGARLSDIKKMGQGAEREAAIAKLGADMDETFAKVITAHNDLLPHMPYDLAGDMRYRTARAEEVGKGRVSTLQSENARSLTKVRAEIDAAAAARHALPEAASNYARLGKRWDDLLGQKKKLEEHRRFLSGEPFDSVALDPSGRRLSEAAADWLAAERELRRANHDVDAATKLHADWRTARERVAGSVDACACEAVSGANTCALYAKKRGEEKKRIASIDWGSCGANCDWLKRHYSAECTDAGKVAELRALAPGLAASETHRREAEARQNVATIQHARTAENLDRVLRDLKINQSPFARNLLTPPAEKDPTFRACAREPGAPADVRVRVSHPDTEANYLGDDRSATPLGSFARASYRAEDHTWVRHFETPPVSGCRYVYSFRFSCVRFVGVRVPERVEVSVPVFIRKGKTTTVTLDGSCRVHVTDPAEAV